MFFELIIILVLWRASNESTWIV